MKYLLIVISLSYTLFANTTENDLKTKDLSVKSSVDKKFEKELFSKPKHLPKTKDIKIEDLGIEISGEIIIRHSF